MNHDQPLLKNIPSIHLIIRPTKERLSYAYIEVFLFNSKEGNVILSFPKIMQYLGSLLSKMSFNNFTRIITHSNTASIDMSQSIAACSSKGYTYLFRATIPFKRVRFVLYFSREFLDLLGFAQS